MEPFQLGVVLDSSTALRHARPDDPVAIVAWEPTLIDPPRAAGARALRVRLERAHPRALVIPFAWHLVTHGPRDDLGSRGTRTLPGDPNQFGGLQGTPEVAAAWAVMHTCADALGSSRVALRTPPSFAPGALGRQRLRAFAADVDADLLWEPSGLWEPLAAAAAASDAGVTLLWPALTGGRPSDLPVGAWGRVDGVGPQRGLDPAHLDALLQQALERGVSTTLLFGGPRAYTNLRRMDRELRRT